MVCAQQGLTEPLVEEEEEEVDLKSPQSGVSSQKVVDMEAEVKGCWAVPSPSMGVSYGCCKGYFTAMAKSCGRITPDPGLLPGVPGKGSGT